MTLQNSFNADGQKQAERFLRAMAAGKTDINYYKGLIDSGADMDIRNDIGHSLLMAAADYGNTEAALVLIDAEADVNFKDHNRRTPLHLAAFNGNLVMMEALVTRGADIDAQDITGLTPLMWTAHFNHPKCAKYLLDAGAKLLLETENASTALDIANDTSSRDVMELILGKMNEPSFPVLGNKTAPVPEMKKTPFRPAEKKAAP